MFRKNKKDIKPSPNINPAKNFFTYDNKTYIETEIITGLILISLDIQSLARMESVSTFFKMIIDNSQIWHQILVHHYPEATYTPHHSKNHLKYLDIQFIMTSKESIRNNFIARAIRYSDFSIEYLESKFPNHQNSFFDIIYKSISGDNLCDGVIHEAVYRCKHQTLLDMIYKNQIQKLRLPNNKIDVNAKTKAGLKILHYACICNQPIKTIKDLIKKGANYNSYSSNLPEYTPLSLAVIGGRNEIVNYLLSFKDIEIFDGTNNPLAKTPLWFAVKYNELDSVKLLLNDERNHDPRALEGPFLLAVSKGMTLIVKLFIKLYSAIINNSNENDYLSGTPLCLAINANQQHIVDLLIKEGADVNLAGKNGCMPIHIAAHGDSIKYIPALLLSGADINARGEDNLKPIHLALQSNRVRNVHFLLLHGAKLEANDLYFKVSDSIGKFISTLCAAKIMLDEGHSVNGIALTLLREYLSPKSFAGNVFHLTGSKARFWSGKSNILYLAQAKMLFQNISQENSSTEDIKQYCEKLLETMDKDYSLNFDNQSYKNFYAIIASLHILSSQINNLLLTREDSMKLKKL